VGDEEAEVLLPRGQVPGSLKIGDPLEVFVYTDSEDRPVATTKMPLAVVGEFAMLEVVSLTSSGAFLDWGLDKDLFCSLREQARPMQVGEEWVVRVYLDEVSQRVTCTTRLNRFLRKDGADLRVGQMVSILVAEVRAEAATVIVDHHTRAQIFPDEILERLHVGDQRTAYVKQIRETDGRVAVSLRPQGFRAVAGERDRVVQAAAENGGFLSISDRSTPEEIYVRFGLSKGAYKKVIGALYREGKITLHADGIRLK
jgi:predicted RNA-binding protein (virulence factor B family)